MNGSFENQISQLLKDAGCSDEIVDATCKKIHSLIFDFLLDQDSDNQKLNKTIQNEVILALSYTRPDIESFIPKIPVFSFMKPSQTDFDKQLLIKETAKYQHETEQLKLIKDVNELSVYFARNKQISNHRIELQKDYRNSYRTLNGTTKKEKKEKALLQIFQNLNSVIDSQNEIIQKLSMSKSQPL